MENFLVAVAGAVAGAVGQAVAQEGISRKWSSVLAKRKEKASQGDYMERLEAAVRCKHSVLATTAKAPITDACVLRERIELKRGYMEARDVLNKHKKRQALVGDQQQQEITQAMTTHSSSGGSPQGTSVARRTIYSITSSFISPMMKAEPSPLSCDDIERFERLAGHAKEFLDLVSRCAWLRHRIYFSGPLVFHLFQRETLTLKILEGSQEHYFQIWSIILEGRGVEAELQYTYTDNERTHKSFDLKFQLRLSQSTDIVEVAINSLQSLATKFIKLGLLLEPATGALHQLASSQDIVSHAPRWRDPQWASREDKYMEITQFLRPNAVCCTAAYGYDDEPCAKESQFFPEEVISLGVRCCISRLELTMPSPSDTTGATVFGDQPPQLDLSALFVPHYYMTHVMDSDQWRRSMVASMLEGQKEGAAFDIIARRYSEPIECSIQEAAEKAIEGLHRMDLEEFRFTAFVGHVQYMFSEGSVRMDYQVSWFSKHGAAFFKVHDAVRYALFERGGPSTMRSIV